VRLTRQPSGPLTFLAPSTYSPLLSPSLPRRVPRALLQPLGARFTSEASSFASPRSLSPEAERASHGCRPGAVEGRRGCQIGLLTALHPQRRDAHPVGRKLVTSRQNNSAICCRCRDSAQGEATSRLRDVEKSGALPGRWGYGRPAPLRRAVNGWEHLGSSPSVVPYAAHCLKCPLFLELGALI
jgi:hypothetical protein